MTTQGLVSIVIPTYDDDPGHLSESVASALWQEGDVDVEVVLVDDGSTRPETVAAIDELGAADRVSTLRRPNAGPAAARNSGIAAAEGEYVLPLDADDRINPGFVEACLAVMAEDVAFAYYGELDFFSDAGRVEPQPPTPASYGLSGFMGGNRIAVTALFRRADWEAVGGYVENPRSVFEDYHLWVDLLRRADGLLAVRAPAARLQYRQREGSRRSHRGAEERLQLTRQSLMATDDPVLLRRMWLATMARGDEIEVERDALRKRPGLGARVIRRLTR